MSIVPLGSNHCVYEGPLLGLSGAILLLRANQMVRWNRVTCRNLTTATPPLGMVTNIKQTIR